MNTTMEAIKYALGTPQGEFAIVLAASASVTGVILYTIIWRPNWLSRSHKKRRGADGPRELYIPQATIAEDFTPLIDQLVKMSLRENGKPLLRIVGSDGAYFIGEEPKKKSWKNALKRWISDGVSIEYVLLKNEPSAIDAMLSLGVDLQSENGNSFTVFVLQKDEDHDFAEEIEKKGWLTFHPTLFHDPKGIGTAMWLEGHHGMADRAEHVRYAGPRAIRGSEGLQEEYEFYMEQSRRILRRCSPLPLSLPAPAGP